MKQEIFENGSRWLKVDFHLHTNADREFQYSGNKRDYVNDYVQALRNAGIGLGVIANHNKFDKDEFGWIRKKAKKSGIDLLPGVELSLSEGNSGLHVIVVFSDDWFTNSEQKNHVETFLEHSFRGIPNYGTRNSNSKNNVNNTVEILDSYNFDYFLIFAHVEDRKGLWNEMKPGRIRSLFHDTDVGPRILGFQKVRTNDKRSRIQQVLDNYYPAEVEGCDPKNLDDFLARTKASYLKLGNFDFKSVKFALRNKSKRLRHDLRDYTHSHIKKIKFEGAGSLGKTEINLSPELNTLIGIRGSGKSSILEGIRYVLDIPFGDHASDTKYKGQLVPYMLQSGGVITLDIIDQRKQAYQIRRIINEKPEVFFSGIKQPEVSILETIIHNPVYFGQRDLSNTRKGFVKDLIEKIAGEALVPLRQKIRQTQERITEIVGNIKKLDQDSSQRLEWEQKKSDAEFTLQKYQEHGFDSTLQKQIAFDRDERKIKQVIQNANDYLSELNEFLAKFEDELKNQAPYHTDQNKPFFEDFFTIHHQLLTSFDEIKRIASEGQNTVTQLQSRHTKFQQRKQSLRDEFAVIERELATDLKQEGVIGFNSEEFRTLKTSLEKYERLIAISLNRDKRSTILYDLLKKELENLNSLLKDEFLAIKNELERFSHDNSPLKIRLKFKGDKKAMLNYIQGLYRGSRIQENTLRRVVNEFEDFGAIWYNENAVQDLLGGSFAKFWEKFKENLNALLVWQVPNEYKIEYRGKNLANHSLGQRASALLLSVLNQKDSDVVIIDQPEDDLDNQTIYKDVISLIHKLKPETQFIFATHNANFPVLGDAEQILSCEYFVDKIKVLPGSIDRSEIQERIVNVMEGGSEAFEKRKQVYEDWNPKN